MKKPRDTYKYHLKVGSKIIYRGITEDIERRGAQHKSRYPKSRIVRVGRRTTRGRALEWERQGGRR